MIQLRIPSSFARRVLLPAALLLLSAHLLVMMYHYLIDDVPWLARQLFDVDEEHNLPTWFSGFILLVASATLYVRRQAAEASSVREKRLWSVLCGAFFVLAIDEVAGLHETINSATDILWAYPALGVVAVVGLYFLPLLKELPRSTLILYVLAGIIFVGGAVGVEIIGHPMDADTLTYQIATLVEEGMEMLGVILLIDTTLRDLAGTEARLSID